MKKRIVVTVEKLLTQTLLNNKEMFVSIAFQL